MPYEDPIAAALRALTDIEWNKRKHGFEARTNHTHRVGIEQMLSDHGIAMQAELSASRSGRYMLTVRNEEIPNIQKAMKTTKATIKPHRRKWHS